MRDLNGVIVQPMTGLPRARTRLRRHCDASRRPARDAGRKIGAASPDLWPHHVAEVRMRCLRRSQPHHYHTHQFARSTAPR